MIGPPKPNPCASCPYRRDVPSGVWSEGEYVKLPDYDLATGDQPLGVFCCHQDDDRVCSGWAGTHDGEHLLALRMAQAGRQMTAEAVEATIEYVSPVPLFESGAEACAHGTPTWRSRPPALGDRGEGDAAARTEGAGVITNDDVNAVMQDDLWARAVVAAAAQALNNLEEEDRTEAERAVAARGALRGAFMFSPNTVRRLRRELER